MPTRVAYAFTTPITCVRRVGAIPAPLHSPLLLVFDEVTYG